MVNVDRLTQYSLFSILKPILLSDSTLNSVFGDLRILEFDIKFKSGNFPGFPLMFIKPPLSNTDPLTINKATVNKTFTTTIMMHNEYFARDNITGYINSIISVLGSNTATLKSSGYKVITIDNLGTTPAVINQKDIFTTNIDIVMEGIVDT